MKISADVCRTAVTVKAADKTDLCRKFYKTGMVSHRNGGLYGLFFRRNISAEFVEDTQSLIIGRYAMFSVKWNFGKMNPAKNARIQNAMYNML